MLNALLPTMPFQENLLSSFSVSYMEIRGGKSGEHQCILKQLKANE